MTQPIHFGWAGFHEEEQAYQEVCGSQQRERPCFADLSMIEHTEPDPIFGTAIEGFDDGWAFWPATERFFSSLRPGNQDRGNCVGYSTVLSAIDGMCHEVMWLDEVEQPFIPLVHFSYGAGRVYIGKNRLGRSDGSTGAWQIAADHEYGFLPAETPGLPGPPNPIEPCEPDNPEYERWGYTKVILDRWAPFAAPHKIGASARLQSAEEIKRAVVELRRPCTIASNQGFVRRGYDARYGITLWRFGGSWAHQMYIRAVVEIQGNWFVYVGNQWGLDYHGDPGKGLRGGFWITFEDLQRWAPRAVVYMRGKFAGRKPEKPDFSVI